MTLQLRPANLGEILDRTASLYRAGFLVYVGIAAVPAGVILGCAACLFLLSAWAGAAEPAMTAVVGLAIIALVILALPVCLIVTALGTAALCQAATASYRAERVTIRGAYAAALKRGWSYVGLMSLEVLFLAVIPFLAWIAIVAVLAVIAAIGPGAAAGGKGSAGVLLLVFGAALMGYFVWMLLRLCLAFPVSVVEQAGAWASLRRATSLSKDSRGRILVLYVLCLALGWIVSIVMAFPALIVLSLIPQMNVPQHSQTMGAISLFIIYGASFASQAFTRPVSTIALMGFYYDQRVRKEAFDVELLMREAGMMTEAATPAEARPWLPPVVAASAETKTLLAGRPDNGTGGEA